MKNLELTIQQVENQVSAKKLESWYSSFINSVGDENDNYVAIGEVLPFDNPDFIVHIMREWVNLQDGNIDTLKSETDDAFLLALSFSQRGVTLEEFKYIMSKNRPKDYKNHPAFFYFHIIDQESHDYFVATTNDENKDITELYLERVERFVLVEIPALKEFFFSYFKKYFPFESLEKHTYLLGGSGSGKSEVLKYLHYNLWSKSHKKNSLSLISIEPHGKLSYELLQFHLMAEDPTRVIYLDPFLRKTAMRLCDEDILGEDYTFILNPFDLQKRTPDNINRMTQELAFAFFEILKSEASPQMNTLVKSCLSTLLSHEGMSVSDLKRFMDDEENEDLVQKGMKDTNSEYRGMMARFGDTSLKGTKNGIYYRLLDLLGDIHLKRILTGKSTIDIEHEMNDGKVIICNLAKGAMGKESAPMLGKFIVALIQGYATKREGEKYIKPTFLFIDEMQNYISPSISEILSENRKSGLHLVLGNQVLGQDMSTKLVDMILSNTAIKLCGDNDPKSLKGMSETMGLKLKDFDKLKQFHFYSYNRENKKVGAVMMKVPPDLVNVKAPYYVDKKALKSYFMWLAKDSGYYIPTASKPKENHERRTKDGKRKTGDKPYQNPFSE